MTRNPTASLPTAAQAHTSDMSRACDLLFAAYRYGFHVLITYASLADSEIPYVAFASTDDVCRVSWLDGRLFRNVVLVRCECDTEVECLEFATLDEAATFTRDMFCDPYGRD